MGPEPPEFPTVILRLLESTTVSTFNRLNTENRSGGVDTFFGQYELSEEKTKEPKIRKEVRISTTNPTVSFPSFCTRHRGTSVEV